MKPIIFSGPMVRAIIEGRKTQTRRIVKQPEYFGCVTGDCTHDRQVECDQFIVDQSPYGKPGDRLWVRETWGGDDLCGYAYRADHPDWPRFQGDGEQPSGPWRSPIHMPRPASRLTLEITDVRVQRVQDISEEDAKAEGVAWTPHSNWWQGYHSDFVRESQTWLHTQHRSEHPPEWMIEPHPCVNQEYDPLEKKARDSFREIFGSLNGEGSWERNDWVWVVGFRRIERFEAHK